MPQLSASETFLIAERKSYAFPCQPTYDLGGYAAERVPEDGGIAAEIRLGRNGKAQLFRSAKKSE